MTISEQKLLVSMLDKRVTTSHRGIYKSKASLYKALWKLRDIGLVKVAKVDDNGAKEWSHTIDGHIVARILKYPLIEEEGKREYAEIRDSIKKP